MNYMEPIRSNHCVAIANKKKYELENNKKPFIFESQTIQTQIWMTLEEYVLGDNYGRCEPMLYNRLFREDFETVKYKLDQRNFEFGNLKYISKIFNPNNEHVVKYNQNYEISCCFGSLVSAFSDIGGSA